MALTEFEKKRISGILERYCEQRVPTRVRDQVRMGFKFRGNTVTLFEQRPAFREPGVWVDLKIAQFRRERHDSLWQLFCRDRNGKWHLFDPHPESRVFEELLGVVEEDSTCIFYG